MYTSDKKLNVDVHHVHVTLQDFIDTLYTIVPSSQRSSTVLAAPIPFILKPLLYDLSRYILYRTYNIFPYFELILEEDDSSILERYAKLYHDASFSPSTHNSIELSLLQDIQFIENDLLNFEDTTDPLGLPKTNQEDFKFFTSYTNTQLTPPTLPISYPAQIRAIYGNINSDLCQTCKQSGELILCEGCEHSYHLQCIPDNCIKPDLNSDDPWFCPDCQQKGATHSSDSTLSHLLDAACCINKNDNNNIFRPRVLICGEEGMGQQYLCKALLYSMDNITVYSLNLDQLFKQSISYLLHLVFIGSTIEESMSQILNEATCHAPSVLYIQSINEWYDQTSENLHLLFESTLNARLFSFFSHFLVHWFLCSFAFLVLQYASLCWAL